MTPREVLALCREKDVKAVDLRFTDLWGAWRHVTLPVGQLDEAVFEEGVALDGASIPGWQPPHESDLVLLPDPQTALLDPFPSLPTLAMIATVYDPRTGEPYARDPRYIAQKAAAYVQRTSVADQVHFAPLIEFYVFAAADYRQSPLEMRVQLAPLGAGCLRGGGQTASAAAALSAASTSGPEALRELRSDLMQALLACGVAVEKQQEQPRSPAQASVALAGGPLVAAADAVQIAKYAIRAAARRQGLLATLMPRPIAGEAGSGMPVQLWLSRQQQPLLAGTGYGGLSEVGMYAVGGLLRHAPALCGLVCPSTNSYQRLGDLARGPGWLAYAQGSGGVACRIPLALGGPQGRRIEFRCPDPLCNPYLALASIAMAVVDGVQLKLSPGAPLEQDPQRLAPAQQKEVPRTPLALDEALTALERDSQFLLRDDVFTPDVLATWVCHKRQQEVEALRAWPHPWEFCQYFDR